MSQWCQSLEVTFARSGATALAFLELRRPYQESGRPVLARRVEKLDFQQHPLFAKHPAPHRTRHKPRSRAKHLVREDGWFVKKRPHATARIHDLGLDPAGLWLIRDPPDDLAPEVGHDSESRIAEFSLPDPECRLSGGVGVAWS